MLRLSKQTDYGIVLLSRFAAAGRDAVLNARDLSVAARLPLPMVSKILKSLSRAGLLASSRGVHGGYWLVQAPEDVSVAAVIAAIDGPIALTECLGHDPGLCSIQGTCPTRAHWGRINLAVQEALEGLSIGDLVGVAREGRASAARASAVPASAVPASGVRT